jgi:hypothetical protein
MELHDEIHERMGGQDKQSIAAWKEPKLRHKRLVSRLLQCHAHLVICMRAEDKLRMETVKEEGSNGREYTKTKITAAKDLPLAERWAPICEKRFPYELITSLVLTPERPGVPVPLKLQEQHRASLPLDKPLTEAAGEALAAWARGAKPAGPQPASLLEKSTQISDKAAADFFPGDAIEYAGRRFNPFDPSALDPPLPIGEMEAHEIVEFATALANLIKAAPAHAKRAWFERNTPELVGVKSRRPALFARLEQLVSDGAPGGASEGPPQDGMEQGGPSNFQGAA